MRRKKLLFLFACVALLPVLLAHTRPAGAAPPAGWPPQSPPPFDFGDLPNSYQTLESAGGPRHRIGGLMLGASVDGEADGQPTSLAYSDDSHGVSNDENGIQLVTPGAWNRGQVVQMSAVISNTQAQDGGYLAAWIDWDADGRFQPHERHVFGALETGERLLELTVPDAYQPGQALNARFRLFAEPIADPQPWGPAENGEVEDYHWVFGPTAITLETFTAQSNHSLATTIFLIAAGLLLITASIVLAQLHQQRELAKAWPAQSALLPAPPPRPEPPDEPDEGGGA